MKTTALFILFGEVISVLHGAEPTAPGNAAQTSYALQNYARAPLSFEPNAGHFGSDIRFIARGAGYSIVLKRAETILNIGGLAKPSRQASVSLKFIGANPRVPITGQELQPGASNYFIGGNPQRWKTGIPHYGRVEYKNTYPGIDVVYYGNQHQLEFDLVVQPGADLSRIRMRFKGADRISIDDEGNLTLRAGGGELHQTRPLVYQKTEGGLRPIAGHYVVRKGGDIGFAVPEYDRKLPLVIDPVLVYSSYLGGAGTEIAFGMALDASGNSYIAGPTSSTDLPLMNAFQSTSGGGLDVFVAKISPTGTLLYSTYLGGTGSDTAASVAVDSSGSAYVTGQASANFPLLNALQPTLKGTFDAFVTKLAPNGNALVYSTYLGGGGTEYGFGIGVDASGNAAVSGYTTSADFPTYPAWVCSTFTQERSRALCVAVVSDW